MANLILIVFAILQPSFTQAENRQHPSVANSRIAQWMLSDERKACLQMLSANDVSAANEWSEDWEEYEANFESEKRAAAERKLEYERKKQDHLDGKGPRPMLPLPVPLPPAMPKSITCNIVPKDFRTDLLDTKPR